MLRNGGLGSLSGSGSSATARRAGAATIARTELQRMTSAAKEDDSRRTARGGTAPHYTMRKSGLECFLHSSSVFSEN